MCHTPLRAFLKWVLYDFFPRHFDLPIKIAEFLFKIALALPVFRALRTPQVVPYNLREIADAVTKNRDGTNEEAALLVEALTKIDFGS